MRKYFYILITLLAVLSIGFVGCKNKPTTVADFIDEPKTPTGSVTPKPVSNFTAIKKTHMKQFLGAYFTSKEYQTDSRKKFNYTIEVENYNYDGKPATAIHLIGYKKDGSSLNTYFQGSGMDIGGEVNEIDYQLLGVDKDYSRASIKFKKPGYAYLSGVFNNTIEFALTNKK